MAPRLALLLAAIFVIGIGSCSKKTTLARKPVQPAMDAVQEGMTIFRNRAFGSTEVACADCHAEYSDSLVLTDRIYSGHSILGAAKRTETWNGKFSGDDVRRTGAGAAKCALIYQHRGGDFVSALSATEAASLLAYFDFISVGDEPGRIAWKAFTYPGDTTISVERLQDMIDRINGRSGNADKGATLYRRACAGCHGRGIGPSSTSLRRRLGAIARAVRAGQKAMPFFSLDKLSDTDIADIRDAIARGIRE